MSGTRTTLRAVVQRVSRAQVSVGDEVVGKIGPGLLVLLGVAKSDMPADAEYLAAKIAGMRIFEDENGKMNLSLSETGGAVLAVSQFTLYGDVRKGRRPSFDEAAPPQLARELYEFFASKIRAITPSRPASSPQHSSVGSHRTLLNISSKHCWPI